MSSDAIDRASIAATARQRGCEEIDRPTVPAASVDGTAVGDDPVEQPAESRQGTKKGVLIQTPVRIVFREPSRCERLT
jgi:hypothetical protein